MITVLTTIGELPPDRRAPVITGIRENLTNRQVARVRVLSEVDLDWLPEAIGTAANRLVIEKVPKRPSYNALFARGNALTEEGVGAVAIMNADISIASEDDVRQLEESLARLSVTVAFCVTSREASGDAPHVALYDDYGLPNYLSTDAWVFDRPLTISRELFYSPGQANCAMLLAHDLLSSGVRLFNPCLDISFLCHKPATERNRVISTPDLVTHHVAKHGIEPLNYFGIPWVATTWLADGYQPPALSTHRPRITLALESAAEGVDRAITRLARVAEGTGRDAQILFHGDISAFYERHKAALCAHPQVVLSAAQGASADLRATCLAGREGNFNTVAFLSSLVRITPAHLAQADWIFISNFDDDVTDIPALGCTLITSVFRSDDFLQGFINNCEGLEGYGGLIDHIFLVSTLSDYEIQLLNKLMARAPHVEIIWNRLDPGLYECWNQGIRLARRNYVSNANVDDLRDPAHVTSLMRDLAKRPEVLVAATALNPFKTYPTDGRLPDERAGWYKDRPGRFGMADLADLPHDGPSRLIPNNMPHCMPVWRRSLHEKFGWFDEDRYGTYADWAFWMKVLRDGSGFGWLNPAPLGFYFVNPDSHNRRGDELENLHKRVEEDFLDVLLEEQTRRIPTGLASSEMVRKLQIKSREADFGVHRNSFNRLIHALDPLARSDDEGVLFLPFLERYFVWGTDQGEGRSENPEPITRDWVGILHVPFDAPRWFNPDIHPETLLSSTLFQRSRPRCLGIITLSEDLRADLADYAPDLPSLGVLHPVEMEARLFNPSAYHARPRVIQVGDWLRKLQAIHRLSAPGHERVMLLKQHTAAHLDSEVNTFGDDRDPAVELRQMVPDKEYDELLSTSVVLCLLYATSANNVVLECIARATPVLINPLPAVVEYLGPDYPGYVSDESEADARLASPKWIEEAHFYLLSHRQRIDLSYDGFCRAVGSSQWYADLGNAPQSYSQKISGEALAPHVSVQAAARPRIAVLANCTHASLALAARLSRCFSEVRSAELYSMNEEARERLAEELEGCDFILSLEHGAAFGPLATAALRDRLGDRLYSLPTPFFSGLTPDMAYVRRDGEIARTTAVLGDYHSGLLLEELRAGFSGEEVVARYVSGRAFDRLDVEGVWADALAALKAREAQTDLTITDFIDQAVAEKQVAGQFMSFNHPAEGLINHIMRDFIRLTTGREAPAAKLTRDKHNLYADAFLPIHPVVAERLGLPHVKQEKFKQPERLGGAYMEIDEFARRSVAFFSEENEPARFSIATPAYLPKHIAPASPPPAPLEKNVHIQSTRAPLRARQIVMTHFGRSGSTVLAQLLNQHSRIAWLGEHFSMRWINSRETYDFTLEQLTAMIEREVAKLRATDEDLFVGHEIKLMNFMQNPSCDMVEYARATADPEEYIHIVLRRRNVLKRICSVYKANQTRTYHLGAGDDATNRKKKFRIDFDKLIDFDTRERGETFPELIAHVLEREELALADMRSTGLSYLELWYEDDIEADPTVAYRKALDHLGLDFEPAEVTLKKTGGALSAEVRNYDELAKQMENSKYAWMLA